MELHGSIIAVRCAVCDFRAAAHDAPNDAPPPCECGALLRPDVVWFGEALLADVWDEAMRCARDCALMVVAGTSLAVSPANQLPLVAQQSGAFLLEINPNESEMSATMDCSVRATGAVALPELAAMVARAADAN